MIMLKGGDPKKWSGAQSIATKQEVDLKTQTFQCSKMKIYTEILWVVHFWGGISW
jgi:hypothetical protein